MPAEPVKPVSQASRSSEAGTYSFWWRSARGTMKPVRPRRASSVRSAATRGALAVGSAGSSNDLEFGFEHGGNLLMRACARQRRLRSTSVVQPSSRMRRSQREALQR